mmetsp:Transcript_9699/g.14611  ORF Transcript_9699/g.14611 Transcript_9699/m.14611 type:complete len:151 (+) Transcript_9699:69-521(+)|eukprot:CAMPEP_0185024616 /NCGR_PEP_ID=MMETSP1103-20130426/7764_1 /TAXON_ID=36769 /ORGANISM="Paraphysomonas bandaiensis, Strain Caron Lab Isolate" /LENGTH=150 /DNA_ID=CAMNT_0027557633 /DNA_START=49 /DNA_END=501 /DNA_ORIENTATION=+
MSRVSDSLIWQVVKNNNSFLHKREQTARSGAVQFSAETGNLMNVNSFKYSGLANSKAVDITSDKDNRVYLKTKAPRKCNAPRKNVATTPLRKDRVRSEKVVKSRGCSSFYRADLSAAAKIKYNKALRDARVRAGIVKAARTKAGRNSRTA